MAATFASQHTSTLPQFLQQAGVSLLVSTYQAGQLIILRADGNTLNTHFCAMEKPMGMAAGGARLSVGSGFQVWDYYNMAAVASKLEPPDRHDACYLPRQIHVTGDIDIHEMEFDRDGELWLVNTRMSCLCTLARDYSVVPRWRPPFISAYDLSDRCHLNGLAMRDGVPAFATALGETDSPAGWRERKADGGLLMELPGGRIIARGLSMPHSPRWYRDKLWYLESGAGRLCSVDPATGAQQSIAELPGFTRGLTFIERYAIVGLSQVRETAVFAGLPLTQRVAERHCGVWIVDIITGETVAYVVFTGNVREIFAVLALPSRYPTLLDFTDPLLRSSYALPDQALAEVAASDPLDDLLARATQAHSQKRLEDAIADYQALLAQQPEHSQACYQLGLALIDHEDWTQARAILETFVAKNPGHAEACNSLGHVYTALEDYEQALHYYNQALAADQQFATAHFNRGLLLLKLGRYRKGWEDFEWRWQLPTFTPFQCPQPQWKGKDEDISDKTLLIHSEQGNGDAIQFARFLPALAQRCKKLILVCPDNLRPLLSTIDGVAETRSAGTIALDSFDTYCPLLSVARLLDITAETLSDYKTPYLKAPDRLTVPTLDAEGDHKVGIVWQGSPTHSNDRYRSCPLDEFLTLSEVPGIQCYSLQTGLDKTQNDILSAHNIINLEAELGDYARTAAMIAQLDLVISVDTATAHLAAALDKPTWVLLGQHSDWRWLTEGDESPWYSSVRLFRQGLDDDWGGLMTRVKQVLEEAQ